jgi:hypothetical protein
MFPPIASSWPPSEAAIQKNTDIPVFLLDGRVKPGHDIGAENSRFIQWGRLPEDDESHGSAYAPSRGRRPGRFSCLEMPDLDFDSAPGHLGST